MGAFTLTTTTQAKPKPPGRPPKTTRPSTDDSRYMRQAVLGRLRQAPYADGAGNMAALGSGGPMLAYAAAAPGGASADGDRPAFPINPAAGAPVQSADLTFWAQGVGAWGRINSDGNAADVNRNLGGVFTGFDRRFGEC